MGIDYYFSFGYGFLIPNTKTYKETEELDTLIYTINKEFNNKDLRYCQDAYDNYQPIFICIGGFNVGHWTTYNGTNENKTEFTVSEENIAQLNKIAEKYNIEESKTLDKNFKWMGYHYSR